MATEIRLNIVNLDDGYNGFYVNGELLDGRETCENPRQLIADLVRGKTVTEYTDRFLGWYGRQALEHLHSYEVLPLRYEDIPDIWWSGETYECSTCDDCKD